MNRKIKIIIIILGIFVILSTVSSLLIMSYINDSKDYIKAFSTPAPEATTNIKKDEIKEEQLTPAPAPITEQPLINSKDNIVNILFLGIDRTVDRDETMGVYRTDTIMFASMNLNSKKIDVLSIPRDSYVYIPIIDKKDKINHAYVWGGMKKEGIKSTIDTVNNFIKYAKVDYYFALDMEPIVDIVDSIGGVELDVEIDMKSNGADLSKGYQLLDGRKAYDYIHWRYSGNGDIDRVKRQQKFLKAVFEKIKRDGKILEVLNIVLRYSKYIQTDLKTNQMIALANFVKEISNDNIIFYNTPGYGEYIDGISYWIPDEEVLKIFNK